jgi:hypothetical protein
MKLSELQPKFLVIERSNVQRREVDDLSVAQGVMFVCPRCRELKVERQHSVVCWFAGREVSDDEMPIWQRWLVSGAGYDDLTVHGLISVQGGCGWRGRIRNGRVVQP